MKNYSILLMALLAGCASTGLTPQEETTAPAADAVIDYTGTTASWMADGENAVKNRIAQRTNKRRAKNVILFVGDGMGFSTLTAGRILEAQLEGKPGEENYLSFERFPNTALVKTYNVDGQVSDSPSTATALNTGTKTKMGTINTAPTHTRSVCKDYMVDAPKPIAQYAEQIGMSTGIVTTTSLTHATPAAVYAHSPERDWEADFSLPDEARENGCPDVAAQILGNMGGDGLEVALGGGSRYMVPYVGEIEEPAEGEKPPRPKGRADGLNIPEVWVSSRAGSKYVTNKTDLLKTDYKATSRLLGLFSPGHMNFDALRGENEPELADMTEAAIKMLSKNKNGYYLMVEAGRIDHGHHGNLANLALHDTVALSKAVRRALELVDLKETLIVVTADHSHTFTLSGYPKRGNPILGLVSAPGMADDEYLLAKDGKPYTTIGYQNGSNAVLGERAHLTQKEVLDPMFKQQSLIPLNYETHAGEDVAAFAIGPWSHLMRGTIEQNEIFHVIDHALKLRKRAARK